ncbi:MAG: hypothetical protein COA45_01050 [Zetaproteobacteria bacterium]|nr:MAG: hypothetical protein COA45_01050 [Zetaproteobacteria bacterium]
MPHQSKVFCFTLLISMATAMLAISPPALAEGKGKQAPPLFNLPDPNNDVSKEMRSVNFKSSKKKKEDKKIEEEEEEEDKKPTLEEIEEADADESVESLANKEKSAEQKLWDKYKALKATASKEENNEDKDSTEDDNTNDDKANKDDENLNNETTETSEKKKNTGIRGIIDEYKKSQTGKGKLNSRSFGDID